MNADPSEDRSSHGSSQRCGKDVLRPGSKVRTKAGSPQGSFPPLCREPPPLSATFESRRLKSHRNIQPDRRSEVKLPQLMPYRGARRATHDQNRAEGPEVMSALAIIKSSQQGSTQSLRGTDESVRVTVCQDGKRTTVKEVPLLGSDLVQVFAERRDRTELDFYYLKEEAGDSYRPYHLRVVRSSKAGSDFYIFSPQSVLHVTAGGHGGLSSLSEWHREWTLWNALQDILFFRSFKLRKHFTWWRRNVRRMVFVRRRAALQDSLVLVLPWFRTHLLLLTGVIEELKGAQRLPLEESRSYTLLDFRDALKTRNQEFEGNLEKLAVCRAHIMTTVREGSYEDHQKLQLHIDYASRSNPRCEPIHLHLLHLQQLKKEMTRSEGIQQKLGSFAALMNHMIVESLATIVQQDVGSFLSRVFKRRKSGRGSLFQSELCLIDSSELTVDPPLGPFWQAVRQLLLTAGESVIQMCERCGFFSESSDGVFSSALTSDLSSTQHPSGTAEDVDSDGRCSPRKLCCLKILRETWSSWTPVSTKLMVQGNRVHGCYHGLPKMHLKRLISIDEVTEGAEEALAETMQEAEEDVQQVCESFSWLVDLHLFIGQWRVSSLKSSTGQPASQYEEVMMKVLQWRQRLHTVPSSISTSNQLLLIQCTTIKEHLSRQLKVIEEEVLENLVEQIKLRSESVMLDLERAAADLRTEPMDPQQLSDSAVTVRECVKMVADLQRRLESIQALKEQVCRSYWTMTEEEATLEQKMLKMWDHFIHLLEEAERVVSRRRPSASDALVSMFSFSLRDLQNVASRATSGSFINPNQDAEQMVSSLSYMCAHVQSLGAKLEHLSRNSQNLQEDPMDLRVSAAEVQKVQARKELWELIAEYRRWLEEWKQQDLSEDVVRQARGKIARWKEHALSVASVIPTHDALLQETLETLEGWNPQLEVLAKLLNPALQQKHLRAVCEGMGRRCDPQKNITVAELLSPKLVEDDQKLITKICRDAQAERVMNATFQKLQQAWESRVFHLHSEQQHGSSETEEPSEGNIPHLLTISQVSSNDRRLTIIDLHTHLAEAENDLMTLTTMLKSPHSAGFRRQIEDWLQCLQHLEELLYLLERCQQTWIFLTKMFHESFVVQKADLLAQFQLVDETFKEMMDSISDDPLVLKVVHFPETNDRFHGNSLNQILTEGLSTMESVSIQMMDLLDPLCQQFPRIWFLSNREVIQLLSFHPDPFTLQPFVRRFFIGVRRLEVDSEVPSKTSEVACCGATVQSHRQGKVLGLFGGLQEHITFLSPLEPDPSALVWLCAFEKQLKLTMMLLIKRCADVRNQPEDSTFDMKVGDPMCHIADWGKSVQPVLDLMSEYPLQCLLVVEQTVWCNMVLQALRGSSTVKLTNMKAQNSAKLKNLGRFIRAGVTGTRSESRVSKYTMMRLRALVQLIIHHAEQLSSLMEVQHVPVESSFEWLSLMKYHLNSEDCSLKGSCDPACYVDVFGHRLRYDYEYFGPEGWDMAHTPSTDRAILGILLALLSYRCGFVRGPCMSGKKTTVLGLGKALGRQTVGIHCCPSTRTNDVQRMLLGALQTGTLLILHSVDLLPQRVLSLLGQHLAHIHHSFSDEDLKGRTADGLKTSECHMVLAGRSFSARLSYGCVAISSKRNASELPRNLQCATRPVALMRPDYSIIAEAMLTSIGFSDAMSLSRHLVCLIGLAKDLLCLPDFLSNQQSCYLVLLQKIISASETHLQEGLRQQELSDQAVKHTGALSSPKVTSGVRKQTDKPEPEHGSHLSAVRGLMEETAIIKAVVSVLRPVLYQHKKLSQFDQIFKDTFPIASQFPSFQRYLEDEKTNQLKEAVKDELQRRGVDFDTAGSALKLYQTMKVSQAVILIGPSGSGKTTCYSTLAGAVNRLAAKAVENEGDGPRAEPQTSESTWNYVDTVVLFPNAVSHEEMFGYFCEKKGWQDGAVAKVVRDSGRHEPKSSTCNKSSHRAVVKWLVLDGEPVGQPSWLDYLTTLCHHEEPFLCLPSGEILASQPYFKLVLEMTDLRDASPSALTRCSLLHFSGSDLWKAVWRSEMEALSFEHKLDAETLKMWNYLAKDLFPSTLSLLRQNVLTSAIHNGESFKGLAFGMQEILSFVRILRSLLRHFGKEVEKAEAEPQADKRAGTGSQTRPKLLARNIFLLAYIWGFSGHLHPGHWPRFNLLAHQVLFSCRYKIVVPGGESVFEHFFDADSEKCPENTPLTSSVTPKYGKYAFLLNLMLEANQPVLLAGEPGSGKTTMCKTLLTFDKPHVSLPGNPLLSSGDFCSVLNNISFSKNCKEKMDSMKRPPLLLFVDDLHEASCDVHGKTSAALETLRQSISKGQIFTFDTHNFKVLRSDTLGYMATCCVFRPGDNHTKAISSRLLRLFSIFVLPSLSMEVILSIHSPRMRMWLRDLQLDQRIEDTICCVVTATKSLYQAVCDRFQPSMERPHFLFSHRDLQKVFWGMYLWQPHIPKTGTEQERSCPVQSGNPASVLNIVRLWMHECSRTFSDRLYSEDETKTLVSLIAKTATTHFGIGFPEELQYLCVDNPPAVQSLSIDTALPEQEDTCEPVALHTLEPKPAAVEEDLPVPEPVLVSETDQDEESGLSPPTLPQILQHMEGLMANLVYGPDLSEASINQQHFGRSSSYQYQDLDVLLKDLCALVHKEEEDRKDNRNFVTKYVVHKQRVNQLLHILRALLIPGGHGVLIGSHRGTGRKTTVHLAAYLTGHHVMEVHPGNENMVHEILKEAGRRSRVDGVHVIILVHEGISQTAREEILVAMTHRTFPGLFTDEELENVVLRVTAEKKSSRYLMDGRMFERYLNQIHRNVHVFLLFPLTGSDSIEVEDVESTQTHLTKALSSSCCVEVYRSWSKQSLVEAAAHCLRSSTFKREREGSEVSLSVAAAGFHQSACQYASVHLKAQPFSPHTFMEFITHFGHLRILLNQHRQNPVHRLTSVLSQLDLLSDSALHYKQSSMRLQEKVAETRQIEKELLRALDLQRSLMEGADQTSVEAEKRLRLLEEQIVLAQEQLRPLFLSGMKVLQYLNPSDLEEVRRYRDPPDGVVKIMDAVCLLFNRPLGWESAKQLLGQSNFFQELEFFDRYTLTGEQLQQLDQILHGPQFESQSVEGVSRACGSLCGWLQAVYRFCCMQHQLQLRQQLEVLARQAQDHMDLSNLQKEESHHRVEEVKVQLQLVQRELEEQLLELQAAERADRDADAALQQLETQSRYWRAAVREAEHNNQTSTGDALILAAIVSYLGPFGPDVRTELLKKWRELCQTGSIKINPEDPRSPLFTDPDSAPSNPLPGFPIPVSERLQLPLSQTLDTSQDSPSNALVVKLLLWGCRRSWVQRWPLLANTQQHVDMSSHSWSATGENVGLEKELECGTVVCADDPELLIKMDRAAQRGLRVLVTHVERVSPSPEFLARLARPAGCVPQGSKQDLQPIQPGFCFFLSTNLPVSLLSGDIHPSVLARVCVVDLSLSSEEVQGLMLTQLMQAGGEKLLVQLLQLQNDQRLLEEELMSEEDVLMDHILQPNTSLLLDSDLLPRLSQCRDSMERLRSEIQQLREEVAYHQSLLAGPRQIATLAATLYQTLQQVSRLSAAYFFSLRGFISVMRDAFIVKGRSLVVCNNGTVPGSVITEVTTRMVTQLLVQYRPRLMKNHVSVLKLLVSVALLQHNQLCSGAEGAVLLSGLPDLEQCSPPPTAHRATSALPAWIPVHVHSDLVCLEMIPAFNGLMASLSSRPRQWQEYLHLPSSSVAGAVPCLSHSHLSLLQRALLWKTINPDCLEGLADAMAVYHLYPPAQGADTEPPHTGNPESLSPYVVKHEGPIILMVPGPRGDQGTSVQPLLLVSRLARSAADTQEVLVKVVGFEVLCDTEVLLSVLDKASTEGHWLVFEGCHLLDRWSDRVVAHLSQLISPLRERSCLTHPRFRLWFITEEDASRSIPAVVRLSALSLVCDPPWDLREELSCSTALVKSFVRRRQSTSAVTADGEELLLRCGVFHSVLLQMQTRRHPGQERFWNHEDLLALMDAHMFLSGICQDPTGALQHLAAHLVHGGHVLHPADLEVLKSLSKICFRREPPLRAGGPPIISDLIGSLDPRRPLQEPGNIGDLLVLGFSEDEEAEVIRLRSGSLKMLLHASQSPVGAARSFCSPAAFRRSRDRLQTLRDHLVTWSGGSDEEAGAAPPRALWDFLLSEWDDLPEAVSSLLSQLQPASPCSGPTSTSFLTDLSRLERRAELLGAYLRHHGASEPPGAYRLSAFRNARGFLAAATRRAAKLNHKHVGDMILHLQVLGVGSYPSSAPLDAVYLCGLELRGASWDTRLGALEVTNSHQPFSMPLVCVRHKVRSRDDGRNVSTCKRSHLMDQTSSPSMTSQLPVYHCPLYLHSEGDDIIMTIPLPALLHPVVCALRRVRLVSLL